ncbi:MAG: dTDP-glucose 4,6-dehydratase [Dehalococcoidia bacterium]|nr:dTDP-glucose 4,6-dehydratase [Dehalococcoidia bacterium]
MRLLVTGCAGFIGSNFVRVYLQRYPDASIIGLDKLTYAGNRANLAHVDDDPRFRFVQADIGDGQVVGELTNEVETVVNFAAESHVDRSLLDPDAFIRTNVVGLHALLEAARQAGVQRFLQVSTDEVYGHVPDGLADESAPLAPRNPYSASKASGDLLALSYWHSHGLPVVLTRGANTIGPYQYPEKVTPLFVTNALENEPLPIYGQGSAVRDYLYVDDHCAAIALVLHDGEAGQVYNVGANEEVNTIELASRILDLLGKPRTLKQHVGDRPGHDYRYSMDSSRLHALGWQRRYDLDATVEATVRWYETNENWWRPIKSGEFLEYFRRNYDPKMVVTAPS